MKLNEVVFYGFDKNDIDKIKEKTGLTGEEEYTIATGAAITAATGYGMLTLIQPDGQVSLIRQDRAGGAAYD